MSDTGIAERWKVLSGSDNWEGLLDPLDSDLRRYLIHYGTMVLPASEAFINEAASKNVGLSRYARRNLLANCGLVKGNPFKYEVTKYFYAPSTITVPDDEYTVRPARVDAVLKESNWIGYVAVATDEGKVALGRRDILIVWRGTRRDSEWNANLTFVFVKAPLFFGQDSEPLVHKGWYDMYTTINQDSQLNDKSARDQIREEVARLVELYKDEEVSITVTGHSLGSSMATLNAVDLAANPINNNNKDILVTAFLYASPKVGDENFKNAISNLQNLRALRVSDVNDIVTAVPPFGWPDGGNLLPLIPYVDVGEGIAIESKKSDYLKPEIDNLLTHDLMLYMHAIDGFQGSQGGFERQGYFDLAKVNKYQGALKDEYRIPVGWFSVKDNGMVQQEDGTYILDDHEPDETF
ncbi:PREDICTED: phospholipase A1-IIalpha-like [Ipomoea nil]|uniref:phospholipase A1-IIalpha-like n=1 Tax=Ipomoea nil TaxID=35883 RepID=UPI00090141D6|nr:PREDICTED: phospholipase A1-IIalpha-like [Ipomoea nil]XP_019168823.1 PREDICTED: phospholipase A1-IIalpha-like [Ipomoea nil]XP_019168828.1 PREDICTED: phospholipase A1-IIalpha-like [Ipomoea nil]